MISEKDKKRYVEAEGCDNCVCWHKHCKAECCKIILLNIDSSIIEKSDSEFIYIKVGKISPSRQWYYSLRGIPYTRGILKLKKNRISILNKKYYYIHKCSKLTKSNLCDGHPYNKPKICKDLTINTVYNGNDDFFVTDNCLFKYKLKGGSM